ncbi:hypothetical protein [Lysobacter sp. CFH 32150]|uniref:hypothetical protein n=1 Tax=Lysobacter sp. CFH 32150 TaxID=2927128 RepID=UPI001FA6AF52|nr:hypothetical protein [Lysobacter sp. CFH 32150]MCI4567220.1 hypothetical protein [Lysobacter sp. CFH 32150]
MSDAADVRPVLLFAARVLGIVWTLPNTALGLVAGTIGIAFGAHAHVRARDLAIVFHRWPWGPGGAITLGNTILHTGDTLDSDCVTYAHRAGHLDEPFIRLADHERAHVYQYMALGPLFLPLYLLSGGISVRNRFERAADRYALSGRGWWPWAVSDERPRTFTSR